MANMTWPMAVVCMAAILGVVLAIGFVTGAITFEWRRQK